MSIAKLKLDENVKLEFGVSITGASGVPETRFVIEGKDFSVSYPCRQTNEGVEVDILGHGAIFKAGEYKARLEVIIENKIYVPLSDVVEFEPSIEISVPQKEEVKEQIVVSKVSAVVKSTRLVEEPIVEEVEDEPVVSRPDVSKIFGNFRKSK